MRINELCEIVSVNHITLQRGATKWILKQVTYDMQRSSCDDCMVLLHWHQPTRDDILQCTITGNKPCVYYFQPETNQESKESTSPKQKRMVYKAMFMLFWDHKDLILEHFTLCYVSLVLACCYSTMMWARMHPLQQLKRSCISVFTLPHLFIHLASYQVIVISLDCFGGSWWQDTFYRW